MQKEHGQCLLLTRNEVSQCLELVIDLIIEWALMNLIRTAKLLILASTFFFNKLCLTYFAILIF